MLSPTFKFELFRQATSSGLFKRRGKNMQPVDEALIAYWDSTKFEGGRCFAAQIQTAIDLLKACNHWLKVKQKKNRTQGAASDDSTFKKRWAKITELAAAIFA